MNASLTPRGELVLKFLEHPDGERIIAEEIRVTLELMARAQSADDVKYMFTVLEEIQGGLALAVFRDDRKVSAFLREFIRDFDRLDDRWHRARLFEMNQLQYPG